MRSTFVVILVAVFTAAPVFAGDSPKPCSTPEFRQFDYWLGNWEVFDSDGKKIGENRIVREQDGCVLHERWVSSQAGTGGSFSMYDAPRNVWHQTAWVAVSGLLLLLEGGLKDGAMVLSGERPRRDGKGRVRDRISWIAQDDGSMHQVWEQSMDGGKTWQIGFLGIYRKKM